MQHIINCRQIDDCSTHVKLTQVARKISQNVNWRSFLSYLCRGIIISEAHKWAQKGCTAHGRLRIFWQGCRGLRPLFADLQEHISQLVQLRQPCKLSQYSAFKPIDTSGHGRKDGYRAAEQRRSERCSYQFAVLAWNAGACIGGLGNDLYCAVVRMCHKSTPL